jgi:type II secretory pathway component PulF
MDNSSVEQFAALNDHMIALLAAGIPLAIESPNPSKSTVEDLERIGGIVVRRLRRGESLSDALRGDEDEAEVPVAYRNFIEFGLCTGNPSSALDQGSQVAELLTATRRTAEISFIYPLVLVVLAYVGFFGFSVKLVPVLQSMYTNLKEAPSPGLRVLQAISLALPYWAIAVPCLLLALIGWWIWSWQRVSREVVMPGPLAWLLGTSRILFQQRCSRFAASLATLLEKNMSFSEACLMAGNLSGDPALLARAKSLAEVAADGTLPVENEVPAGRFPQFLHWSIWHAEESIGRVDALKIASRLYRDAAEHGLQRQRTLLPVIVLIVFGGTITLLYGLALFVPVVELLHTLAGS